jgi:hypothetical protein
MPRIAADTCCPVRAAVLNTSYASAHAHMPRVETAATFSEPVSPAPVALLIWYAGFDQLGFSEKGLGAGFMDSRAGEGPGMLVATSKYTSTRGMLLLERYLQA